MKIGSIGWDFVKDIKRYKVIKEKAKEVQETLNLKDPADALLIMIYDQLLDMED